MKSFIKKLLREQMIDGQNMNSGTETLCNKMTVDNYHEALMHVEAALKGVSEETRTKLMQRIHTPLENMKNEQNKIDGEVKSKNMSGDSMVDEADTYWHQIQSTICEQGKDFQ
jgi:pyocin large subunit-like protein